MAKDKKQMIKIKLKSFDHRLLDQAVSDILFSINATGAGIMGPIPIPTKIERFTVNRSPHIDKKSREQFEIRTQARLLIITPSPGTIDALTKLELASGVNVKIELIG